MTNGWVNQKFGSVVARGSLQVAVAASDETWITCSC